MSQDQAKYQTGTDETREAMEMLGKGYDPQPAAIIEVPRNVLALQDKGLVDYQVWGWVKISAKFIAHIKLLRGAKLAIWQTMALSIDENGECSLSANEIAKLTGYSRSEVIESQKELDEMGYLTVTRSSGKKNVYTPEFAARGASTPTTSPKNDQSRKTTSPVPLLESAADQSSPSIGKTPSSIKELKESLTDEQLKFLQKAGLEWLLFKDGVTLDEIETALQETKRKSSATVMFEKALGFSKPLPWWSNKDWTAFAEWVTDRHNENATCFGEYNIWRNEKYTKGGISNNRIRGFVAEFYDSWDMFNMSQPGQTTAPVTLDEKGIVKSW